MSVAVKKEVATAIRASLGAHEILSFDNLLGKLRTLKDKYSEDDVLARLQNYLSLQLRSHMITLLASETKESNRNLDELFRFATKCSSPVLELLSREQVLDMFYDLFECCPEAQI